MEDGDAPQHDPAGHHPRGQRPPPERLHQGGVARPPGVGGEVHGGQVGADDHGQTRSDHRRRVDVAVDRMGPGDPGRNPPRGDRPRHRAEKERRDHRRGGEGGAEEPLQRHARHRLPEGKAGAPQDHADGHQREGHVEAGGDGGEGLGEPRPQHDQHKDQPHNHWIDGEVFR